MDFVCLNEVANDVELHTTVVGNDLGAVAFSVDNDFFGRYFGDEICLIRVGEERFRK